MNYTHSAIADVEQMVTQFIESRQISHREYHRFCAAILSDNRIDEEERVQINRLFDAIQSGQLKVIS